MAMRGGGPPGTSGPPKVDNSGGQERAQKGSRGMADWRIDEDGAAKEHENKREK